MRHTTCRAVRVIVLSRTPLWMILRLPSLKEQQQCLEGKPRPSWEGGEASLLRVGGGLVTLIRGNNGISNGLVAAVVRVDITLSDMRQCRGSVVKQRIDVYNFSSH